MTKTYKPLQVVVVSKQCSELLANQMQCPRAANYVCVEDQTLFCRYHATLRMQTEPITEFKTEPKSEDENLNLKEVKTNVNDTESKPKPS